MPARLKRMVVGKRNRHNPSIFTTGVNYNDLAEFEAEGERLRNLEKASIFDAVRRGDSQLVRKLSYLSGYPEVYLSQRDSFYDTPLLKAIQLQNAELVETLIELGASTKDRNAMNETQLEFAKKLSNRNIIEILKDAEGSYLSKKKKALGLWWAEKVEDVLPGE